MFRTREEMKRWKIVTKDGQFMVYPRPQKYPTLEAVIEVSDYNYCILPVNNHTWLILYKPYNAY